MSWDNFFDDLENEVEDWEKDNLRHDLSRVALNEWEVRDIYLETQNPMTRERFDYLKQYIYENTPCPIASGFNYSQTDIKRKLKREL